MLSDTHRGLPLFLNMAVNKTFSRIISQPATSPTWYGLPLQCHHAFLSSTKPFFFLHEGHLEMETFYFFLTRATRKEVKCPHSREPLRKRKEDEIAQQWVSCQGSEEGAGGLSNQHFVKQHTHLTGICLLEVSGKFWLIEFAI